MENQNKEANTPTTTPIDSTNLSATASPRTKHKLLLVTVGIVLLLLIGIIIYSLSAQNTNQQSQNTQTISISPTLPTSQISVTPPSHEIKATVLSPDRSKMAYVSKSEESIENEKTDTGYKKTSTNVWIADSNGSNPVQITTHIDFVYRNYLHWLDNNRLLFVDGEETVRVYNTNTQALQTVLGPEKAVQACLDACGYETRYYYSPDYTYLIRLTGGGSGVVEPSTTAVLDTRTLQTNQINEKFGVNFETVSFPNNTTLTFTGYELSDYDKQINITINLPKAQVTKH